MKFWKKTACAALIVCAAILLSACGNGGFRLNIDAPKSIASVDEADLEYEKKGIEPSDNVNGMRFNLTPYEFTERYNRAKRLLGDTDLIIAGNWRVNGDVTTDENGVKIRYCYYDDYNVNFTATVEVDTGKLMNIGVGTTMSYFMAQDGEEKNSDKVLRKAALMAQAICRFEDDSTDVLQDIFYRTATESNNTIWFKGFLFTLSTMEDHNDSKNNLLLFRVFPISEEHRKEWKPVEYEK